MYRIVQDDREKKGYDSFPGEKNVVTKRLNVGDYTIEGFEDTFAVERKSLDDLANSVGTDRLRFENEIRRAHGFADRNEDGNPIPGTKPDKALKEFKVVIEGSEDEVYAHNYWSNIHPNSVIGTVNKWPLKYDNLTFEWCDNWRQAKSETLATLDNWYLSYADVDTDY